MDAAPALEARPALRLSWRITPLRLALGLGLLAVALRMIGLGLRPLWLDEAYSAYFAGRDWHYLWTVVPTYEPHPPFYYSLLKLWRDLFGGGAVALRGFSVLCALLTVPVVIAAALELERQRPSGRPLLSAGMAGFLAACSPMLITLDQEARPYPLLILAYSVAILGLLRLIREFAQGGAGAWGSWALLAAGTEVALWAHGLGLLYALCLAAALMPVWLANSQRDRLVRGLAAAAVVTLLYLPCLAMVLNRAGDWGTGWLRWQPVMLLRLIGLYTVPYEAVAAGALAAVAILLLAKRALQSALEQRGWNADKALLVLWWGPPLLAATISILFVPVFLPRTLAGTVIPAYLCIAFALARTQAPRERLILGAAICVGFVAGSVQMALRPPAEAWDQVGDYLARSVRTNDLVWLYPNDSALPLREANAHAAGKARGLPGDYPAVGFKGPIRAGSPAVVSLTGDQARQIASAPALRNTRVIWLVTRQARLFDPRGELPAALRKVRREGPPHQWGYIKVQPYYLPGTVVCP
jgi:mannosyltransferase